MKYPVYYSMSAIDGAEIFHAPNYFIAIVERDLFGNPDVSVILEKRRIADSFFAITDKNNVLFSRGLESDLIQEGEISSWNFNKIKKFINRGQYAKAELKIAGLVAGIVFNLDKDYSRWVSVFNEEEDGN